MKDLLTTHQIQVAQQYLADQGTLRTHLVVALSGAHAYGFPSPDSDLDLKAIHVTPTATLLGLAFEAKPAEYLQVIDGVEVDYSSNEIQPVLKGVIGGNGNYLERILGHLQLDVSDELASLKPLVSACLSRAIHRHYSGFARAQLKEWEKTHFRSAKKLLYVLRTAMTGIHALQTGRIDTDLTHFADDSGLSGVAELIAQKKRGEKSDLPESLSVEWQGRVQGFLSRLDEAVRVSVLPSEPTAQAAEALEGWLLDLRRRRF